MPEPKETLTPRAIVAELDRHIIGQNAAKRAVAVALRNRWRRQQVSPSLRDEILPKNILMIGPTGVGKTEIARRLARLADSPFIKVEATKFTEVGYVGRDVEQIIRDLVDSAIKMTRDAMRRDVAQRAAEKAEERLLNALVGSSATPETRVRFRGMLVDGALDDKNVTVEVREKPDAGAPLFDVPGMPGAQMGMINLNDMFGKAMNAPRMKPRDMTVAEARRVLEDEEADDLIDDDRVVDIALDAVEQNGIVFLDEIDKIAARSGEWRGGGDISREGVQRDLLPLIEGTTVSTKHGPVRTDHILFIASGAFHLAKPSDLLPELQGRLPIRVELSALSKDDFRRILTEPEANLIRQYTALMETEGVTLTFDTDAIDALASLAADVNMTVENIGARRLHTVMEKLLEDISFDASDRADKAVRITRAMVYERLSDLAKNTDLSRFVL